jgi:hypothetical protein
MVLALLMLGIAGGVLPMPAPRAEAQGISETASSVGNVINDTPGSCAQRGGTWNGVTGAGYCSVSPNSPAGRVQGGFDALKEDSSVCPITSPSVCLSNIVYVFTVGLGSGLAYISAFMLDTSVSLSLNSAAYALTFLSAGWTTTRDLANMAFILILVYLAFTIMFRAETTNTIRTLAWVIFIALIINFSFFFTRVVIDAGNILAVQFYNSVGTGQNGKTVTMAETFAATNSGTGALANTATGAISYVMPNGTLENTKDLTASIMHGLNVQELLNTKGFKSFESNSGFLAKFITLSLLYLTVGACYFILAAMFLAVGVKFIIRIAVLWFLIIASPLAFVCKAVPNKPHISGQYDKWQSMLVHHAFYPAFFLFIFFFLSVIMTSMNADGGIMGNLAKDLNALAANPNLGGGTYLLNLIAVVFIRLGLVIAMLYIALKASEALSVRGSEVARSVTGFAFSQTGRLAGAPVGYFARNTIGWGGAAMANKSADFERKAVNAPMLKRWAFEGAGKATKSVGTALGTATFDPRNAPGASILKKGVQNITNGPINAGSPPAGGYIAQEKERNEKRKAAEIEEKKKDREASNQKALQDLIEKSARHDELEAKEKAGTIADPEKIEKTALKHQMTGIADKINGLTKGELEIYDMAKIQKIIKHLDKDAVKKISESDKYSEKDKDVVRTEHNAKMRERTGEKAIGKMQEMIDLMRDQHKSLADNAKVPAAMMAKIERATTAGKELNPTIISEASREAKGLKTIYMSTQYNGKSEFDRKNAKAALDTLNEVIPHLEKLKEHIEDVPETLGGTPNEKEFIMA